tara:strand:+ start:3235 stop:3516 length:282 start_codon:yes stop_codon:yes gene_type:complete
MVLENGEGGEHRDDLIRQRFHHMLRPIQHPTIPFTNLKDLKKWLKPRKHFLLDLLEKDLVDDDNRVIEFLNKFQIPWKYTGEARLMSINYDKK